YLLVVILLFLLIFFFFQAEDGIRDFHVTGVQTCALPIYIVSAFAGKYFKDQLWDTDEGRSIGLSYFKERGFREDILKKFEIGYRSEERRVGKECRSRGSRDH